jgi:hypothetical protein
VTKLTGALIIKINITTSNMFVFVPRISQVIHVLPEHSS